jgi:chaperonin GroEL (HSP60 family)
MYYRFLILACAYYALTPFPLPPLPSQTSFHSPFVIVILWCQAVADVIRTTLGPRSMLKMLLDPMGGIAVTNDGNAILREIDVSHPAAKSMIELSRTQDEEVGDGTTSVIILGECVAGAISNAVALW